MEREDEARVARLCVCVWGWRGWGGACVCACADVGERKGQSDICNALLN